MTLHFKILLYSKASQFTIRNTNVHIIKPLLSAEFKSVNCILPANCRIAKTQIYSKDMSGHLTNCKVMRQRNRGLLMLIIFSHLKDDFKQRKLHLFYYLLTNKNCTPTFFVRLEGIWIPIPLDLSFFILSFDV